MTRRAPVLSREWLPTSSYGNANTRTAVDMLADAVIRLDGETGTAHDAMREQLDRQEAELTRLRAQVGALTELLLEQQLVRSDELERRTDTRLARLHRPPPAPPAPAPHGGGGGPYRGAPAPAAQPATETCLRCGAEVPLAGTHITESGVVCDRCWHSSSID